MGFLCPVNNANTTSHVEKFRHDVEVQRLPEAYVTGRLGVVGRGLGYHIFLIEDSLCSF